METEVRNRRAEELEALQAYYGSDLRRSLRDENVVVGSPASSETQEAIDDDCPLLPLEGPWFLRIRRADIDVDYDDDGSGGNNGNGNSSHIGHPTLEIRPSSCYPLGETCPEPILHNVMMKPQLKRQLLTELRDMYEPEMDVGIMWGERCREELMSGEMAGVDDDEDSLDENDVGVDHDDAAATAENNGDDSEAGIVTFVPPTTRYHQPIRRFPASVVTNPDYRRTIVHTPPFHPPKSGPSETMIAHVCSVTCTEHVQWALAELLFNDKKVAKATHNMFAYRFTDGVDGSRHSDNDDDGEKGSGNKLASLLEMCRADDVLVVVSRWFGGMKLGPARFKWIAGVARDGLVQGKFISG